MSTSISSPITVSDPGFTGVSKFASSLQQVLGRAESIAGLPLNSLEAQLTTLSNQQSALQGVDTVFSSLQSSVASLATAATSSILSSSVSDGSIVNASLQTGATAGTYSIEVVGLGSYSTALSVAGQTAITNPATQGLDGSTSYTLTADGTTTTVTAGSSSLNSLVSAINAQTGGQAQASIVNIGSSGAPDYRLSLRSAKLGTDAVSLSDGLNSNLISSATSGSLASYKLNGLSNVITSDSRAIALAPGLSVTLLGQSATGQATNITVGNSSSGLESAFSSFASAYNSAQDALAQQHGTGGGALQGESLVWSLGDTLNQLSTYSNGSPDQSLAAFGITADKTGQISVDSATFESAATANFAALLSTLGSPTTGGFLQAATNALTGAEDPTSGSIKTEETDVTNQIAAQNTRITDEQNTLTQLQSSLTAQISSADAAIAQLENQVSYVSGLFAQYTGYNANNTNNGVPTL
jgi:flagellar hook-associated protein 2